MYYHHEFNFSPEEVLVYLRKSRTDDPALSVEDVLSKHETILDEWSEKFLNGRVPEENKYREIVSGETIADRPEVQTVLSRVESPKIKAVLVVEVQRLSRGDLEDAGRLIKLLRFTNTLVITPPKTYNLQDDYDRDIFERELKRGNEFLEYQKKIMRRGRELSVSQGNYIGSQPPYGYEKCEVLDGKRKCPTLRIKPDEADAVRLIFDLYVNKDMGGTNICHHLDKMGIKPAKGSVWSPAQIKELLSNVHYIGKVKWNYRKTFTVVEDGEFKKVSHKSKDGEYLVYEGKHEAIVSEELFNAAQQKRGRNHRAKPDTKVRNPLASILFCQCGRAMSLRTFKSHNSPPRLSCDNQVHCHTGSCLFNELIERVAHILETSIKDFEFELQNDNKDTNAIHNRLIKSLERKMTTLKEKELAQWEAQANPDETLRMPKEIFRQLNEKLQTEIKETQQALDNAYTETPPSIDYTEKIQRFTAALNALNDPNVEPQIKNRLLKACIERIDYHREKPQRERLMPGEKKGMRLPSGGSWTSPPIILDVKLRL